ncbi:NrfD/PsrC family molybdoenzyme membrane anchor subunit [Eggerthella timonensis]|uniref:NrfD/PsrC family molybdoenzyme membrane anchor subunit n=1 Tax=Eggerthella timonensis TaxID=1871008 RepID=UPI000C76A7D6|nr:NrfD/PsrC family molybdoenzyme membrane anchor subunit [Eggerthella timonensis]
MAVWDGVVACDLFLAGLGAGAFLLSILAGWAPGGSKKIRLIGSIVGPVAVAAGALTLMIDARAGLGDPVRFFYLVTNLGSPMTWGVICLSLFLAVSVISLVVQLCKKDVPRALDVLGIVCAAGVATYTGVLLGYSASYPLWNLAVLPFLFVCSAALTGFAFVSAVAYFAARDELEGIAFLPKVEAALPALVGLFLIVLLAVTAITGGEAGSVAATATVQGMLAGSNALVFWLGAVACGVAVPLVAGIVRLRSADHRATTLALVGYVAACVGGFALRYVIVVAAVGMSMGAGF